MSDDKAWDGLPENPERDGWHWVLTEEGQPPAPHLWEPASWMWEYRGVWAVRETYVRRGWRYLGPCLTPGEVAERDP